VRVADRHRRHRDDQRVAQQIAPGATIAADLPSSSQVTDLS
jgi:hypothetical protein